MSYPYKPHQILEFLKQQKCLPASDTLRLEKIADGKFQTRPELVDGPFVDMRYLGKAPVFADSCTYDATFLVANQRVRGVGYNEIGRNNFRFKRKIPKGWHQNVCDPNLPTDHDERDVHHPLPDFCVTDFKDFIVQTAKMWNIDLGWERESELFK